MIGKIQNITRFQPDRPTQAAKQIGIFTASSSPRLQYTLHRIVTWKFRRNTARVAPNLFHTTIRAIFIQWLESSLPSFHIRIALALITRWTIDPRHDIRLKVFGQQTDGVSFILSQVKLFRHKLLAALLKDLVILPILDGCKSLLDSLLERLVEIVLCHGDPLVSRFGKVDRIWIETHTHCVSAKA